MNGVNGGIENSTGRRHVSWSQIVYRCAHPEAPREICPKPHAIQPSPSCVSHMGPLWASEGRELGFGGRLKPRAASASARWLSGLSNSRGARARRVRADLVFASDTLHARGVCLPGFLGVEHWNNLRVERIASARARLRARVDAGRDRRRPRVLDLGNENGLAACGRYFLALGFDPGTLDGLAGPKTDGPLRRFQASAAPVVEGIPGAANARCSRRRARQSGRVYAVLRLQCNAPAPCSFCEANSRAGSGLVLRLHATSRRAEIRGPHLDGPRPCRLERATRFSFTSARTSSKGWCASRRWKWVSAP
jgi:hypothetical protein